VKTVKFSLRSRLLSFNFACNGVLSLLKNEHNSRIHLVAAFAAIVLGIILKINSLEWCLIILVIGIVFLSELLNSAIEILADLINPEWSEGIKKVKDYSAAAVLISAIVSISVGGIIFIPKLFR
jgi:diacylglycerol kinase (ATP)